MKREFRVVAACRGLFQQTQRIASLQQITIYLNNQYISIENEKVNTYYIKH